MASWNPRLMAAALTIEPQIEKLARDIAKSKRRALSRPRHQLSAGAGRRAEAEGNLLHPCRRLRRGELKHGPIALIDENMPVVVIAPFDRGVEKTVSNMQKWRPAAATSS